LYSEAVKLLKIEYCVKAIEKYKIDRALIFCRTKLDCDNLEHYLTKLGGGPKSTNNHQFSCNVFNCFLWVMVFITQYVTYKVRRT
jgi:superfamily II DNA/RNA helicase